MTLTTTTRNRPRCRRYERRGSALILVLGLVAITLGISYAMMRTQGTALQISENQDRRGDARQAALTGLWVGYRKMHESDWGGVGSVDQAWLSETEAYSTTYEAGDTSLSPGDPDYDQYPYRITIHSQGMGIDPDDQGVISVHNMSAVVELLPTAIGSQPSGWSDMQNYTLYQTHQGTFELELPYRIEGTVRAQSQLLIAKSYPDHNSARERNFSDLELMRVLGQGDYRPFTGPIYCNTTAQTANDYNDLVYRLGVSLIQTSSNSLGASWAKPTSAASYRLYPGGPSYTVQVVSGTLTNTTLEPDPLTNPLGIFYSSNTLQLGDNVTIQGSLVCNGEIRVQGTNVQFEPFSMPAINNGEGELRLPVVCCEDFTVTSTGSGSLRGLMTVFGDFEIDPGPATTAFTVTGRVVSRRIRIGVRDEWENLDWGDMYGDFLWQFLLGQKYFPKWLKLYRGLDYQPIIVIAPETGTITYDWHSFGGSSSILARDATDDLLHWELLDWNDNP